MLFFNESGLSLPLTHRDFELAAIEVLSGEKRISSIIELVFVDEDEIVSINKTYLHRDYVTDIISFAYHEQAEEPVSGTLFCCAQRIFEQAKEFECTDTDEFLRVCIHGILHLCGYDDSTTDLKTNMTELENRYLSKYYDRVKHR